MGSFVCLCVGLSRSVKHSTGLVQVILHEICIWFCCAVFAFGYIEWDMHMALFHVLWLLCFVYIIWNMIRLSCVWLWLYWMKYACGFVVLCMVLAILHEICCKWFCCAVFWFNITWHAYGFVSFCFVETILSNCNGMMWSIYWCVSFRVASLA